MVELCIRGIVSTEEALGVVGSKEIVFLVARTQNVVSTKDMVGSWCLLFVTQGSRKTKLLLEDTAVLTKFSVPACLVLKLNRQADFPELPSVAF